MIFMAYLGPTVQVPMTAAVIYIVATEIREE
jgi:hypothetical protein